ncbi:MAG: hypothetical protein ABSE69_12155, partial [Roseiarcus sp.]
MSAAPTLVQQHGFEPGASMRRRLAGFVNTLRGAGFAIGHAETADAARVLASPAADRPDSFRAALKALFCSRQTELARFDELFAAFWRGRGVRQAMRITTHGGPAQSPRRFEAGPGGDSTTDSPERSLANGPEDGTSGGRGRRGGASAHDALTAKD